VADNKKSEVIVVEPKDIVAVVKPSSDEDQKFLSELADDEDFDLPNFV
jgi:hypothetical protein